MKLCRAILSEFRDQLRVDCVCPRGHVGLHEGIFDEQVNIVERESEDHKCPRGTSDGSVSKFGNGEGPFFDDLTKQRLRTELVKIARRKELAYLEAKAVWRRVTIC